MLETLKQGGTDLVVGSRYLEGGGVGGWSKTRRWLSRFSTVLSRLVLRTRLSDPLSGYFMLTRELHDRALRKVSGRGFKILLDLVASDGPVRAVELPYTFGLRQAGESKLDTLVAYEFALVLAHKLFGRAVPVRFVMFVAVGTLGAIVHLGLLGYFFLIVGTPFLLAQTVAAIAAMTLNYSVNNVFTYRDNRLAGRDYVTGLALFSSSARLARSPISASRSICSRTGSRGGGRDCSAPRWGRCGTMPCRRPSSGRGAAFSVRAGSAGSQAVEV